MTGSDGGHRAAGRVSSFDDDRGLGEVRSELGGTHPFHCTAVRDGSRHIEPGAPVSFVVVPGHLGCWEAADLTPLGADQA